MERAPMERSSVKLLVLSIRAYKNRAKAAGYQCDQPWCYYCLLHLQWFSSKLLETMGWIATEHQDSRIFNRTRSRTRANLLEKDFESGHTGRKLNQCLFSFLQGT